MKWVWYSVAILILIVLVYLALTATGRSFTALTDPSNIDPSTIPGSQNPFMDIGQTELIVWNLDGSGASFNILGQQI